MYFLHNLGISILLLHSFVIAQEQRSKVSTGDIAVMSEIRKLETNCVSENKNRKICYPDFEMTPRASDDPAVLELLKLLAKTITKGTTVHDVSSHIVELLALEQEVCEGDTARLLLNDENSWADSIIFSKSIKDPSILTNVKPNTPSRGVWAVLPTAGLCKNRQVVLNNLKKLKKLKKLFFEAKEKDVEKKLMDLMMVMRIHEEKDACKVDSYSASNLFERKQIQNESAIKIQFTVCTDCEAGKPTSLDSFFASGDYVPVDSTKINDPIWVERYRESKRKYKEQIQKRRLELESKGFSFEVGAAKFKGNNIDVAVTLDATKKNSKESFSKDYNDALREKNPFLREVSDAEIDDMFTVSSTLDIESQNSARSSLGAAPNEIVVRSVDPNGNSEYIKQSLPTGCVFNEVIEAIVATDLKYKRKCELGN